MDISIIAAIGKNRELGYQNKLLWHIPEDLKQFKKLTLNHHILCGRKTYLSIGRVLPQRTMFILSQNKDYQVPGAYTYTKIEEALKAAKERGEKELFVIGGGEVYTLILPLATKIYLSEVDWEGTADTYFPQINENLWIEIEKQEHSNLKGIPDWTYRKLERKLD